MTGTRRGERGGAGGTPPAPPRFGGSARTTIVVVGGSHGERARIAGALHRDSRLSSQPFCVAGAGSDEGLLRRSLLCWLGHDPGVPPLACERGTLFVDDVCALPADVQR